MSVHSRLDKSFEEAPRLPLNYRSKYVLVSDCHRGTGTTNDNFLKNQNLYYGALQYYYRLGYTYIELGDGDELWENKNMGQIISIHSDIFCLLSHFHRQGRLFMLHGNHDMIKKNSHFLQKNYSQYPRICGNNPHLEKSPLFPGLKIYSGIILENAVPDSRDLYLTHGHQADVCNSVFWRVSRFLVRHLWKPLEHFGVLDPTSAAKNYTRKQKTERRLYQYAQQENRILITGHTHRPSLSEDDLSYCNCGSCVHPSCITCLEIEHMRIRLVKWRLAVKPDMSLYAARELISGPAAVGIPSPADR